MNKKIATFGVAVLSVGAILITPTADAFWGMGNNKDNTAESFTSFQQIVQSFTSWESFHEAMEAKREERRAEREAMKEQITHTSTKIDNGVILTITSDDISVVEQIKENHAKKTERKGNRENNLTRTVVEIDNGLQITITTEDADALTRLHDRADNGWENMGRHGKNKRSMKKEGKRGHGNGQGRGQGRMQQ